MGRYKYEGFRHSYTVPDDVHDYIKSHGEGKFLTSLIRKVMVFDPYSLYMNQEHESAARSPDS